MKRIYLSLLCLIGMIATLALGAITGHNLWFVVSVILFALGLSVKSLKKVIKPKKVEESPMGITVEEPHYKKLVREYVVDFTSIDTPEKAKQNLARCLTIFQAVCDCRASGVDKYTVEHILKFYKDTSIEAVYWNPEIPNLGIRARLSVPNVGKIYEGFSLHIPVLTTGDHFASNQDLFDLFVSKFIEEGVIVKFNL